MEIIRQHAQPAYGGAVDLISDLELQPQRVHPPSSAILKDAGAQIIYVGVRLELETVISDAADLRSLIGRYLPQTGRVKPSKPRGMSILTVSHCRRSSPVLPVRFAWTPHYLPYVQ